jgi:hypothetical protein
VRVCIAHGATKTTEFPILLENKRIWGTTYADGGTINGSFKLFPNSLYF